MIREKYEDKHLIVFSERTDLEPGDYFTLHGVNYQALTYPVGAKKEIAPGVELDRGMVTDPEHPLPPGTLTARKVGAHEDADL